MRRMMYSGFCFLLLIAGANIFFYFFLRSEVEVYSWDFAGYELQFSNSIQLLRQGIVPALHGLYTSLAFSQHSTIVPFLLAPLGALFGDGRSVYLFGVLNILALPAIGFFAYFFIRLVQEGRPQRSHVLIPVIVVFFMPQFWTPILRGYYDVSTWIPMVGVWLILLAQGRGDRFGSPIVAGALLTLLIFIRRWTAYWAVSFFFANGLLWFTCIIRNIRPLISARWILVAGLSAFLVFVIISPIVFFQMSLTDYGSLHQAFREGMSQFQLIKNTLSDYGVIGIALAFGGFAASLKNSRLAPFALFALLQGAITLFLFTKVQRLEVHHQYQLALSIALLQALCIYQLVQSRFSHIKKKVMLCGITVLMLGNILFAFVPLPSYGALTAIFTSRRTYPLVRHDSDAIRALLSYLDTDTDSYGTIYVLASSSIFNDDMLRNSCRYLSVVTTVCKRVHGTAHVDTRDGFPDYFFDADYVIVADPIQYHLRPEDQYVVGLLANQFLTRASITRSYERMPASFSLDEGVRLYFYKRIRSVPQAERDALLSAFCLTTRACPPHTRR